VLTTTAAALTGAPSDVSQPADTGSVAGDALASAAPVGDTSEPVLTTTAASLTGAPSDVSQPADTGSVAGDTLASAAPDTSEPVLTTTAAALIDAPSDVSQLANTGSVAGDALASAAPVPDATEPVLTSAGDSLSNPATEPVEPAVPDAGSAQTPGSSHTLLALATTADAPIGSSGSATTAPENVVTDTSNAAATSAVASDVIALNDAPPPPADSLFNGTQYTDYGVMLSSDIAPSQTAVSQADAASAHDVSAPMAADVQKPAPPPPDIVDNTPIDHVGTHDAIL
jgi:hypothetical protein